MIITNGFDVILIQIIIIMNIHKIFFFFNTLFGSLNHFGQNVLHLVPKKLTIQRGMPVQHCQASNLNKRIPTYFI